MQVCPTLNFLSPHANQWGTPMENEVIYRFPRKQDEEVYISLREYKDRQYIDLRIFFQPKDSDEMRPTKKGITIEIELLKELKKGILASEKRVLALQANHKQ